MSSKGQTKISFVVSLSLIEAASMAIEAASMANAQLVESTSYETVATDLGC